MSVLGDEERKIHVPNLCVVQQMCTHCLDINDISIRCNHCGVREYVFKDEPVKQLIDLALAPRKQFKKIVCIAHNAQGFDAQFIFKYIVEQYRDIRVDPTVIMNGSKIILMEIANVKLIDSLNYFHMPLSSLPKAYGLNEIEKDVFPHGYSQPRPDENRRGIVLQFHGCFWHRCPRCFRINRDTALTSGDSMDIRYEIMVAINDKTKQL